MYHKLRMVLRYFVRRIIGCKKKETIQDCISRRLVIIKKCFYKESISVQDLENKIKDIGVSRGDSVLIHCAWREFYNYTGTPEDMINSIINVIGDEGNILMPCYGDDLYYFDVKNTPSAAGVLSEVFRTRFDIMRSCSAHFSMAAMGPKSEYLVNEHFKSNNGFDEFSPYYKFINIKNSKVIFLGLGRKPKKNSLIHVAEYSLKDKVQSANELFDTEIVAELNMLNSIKRQRILFWSGNRKLNNKTIQKIYENCKSYNSFQVSNLVCTVIDCKEEYDYICESIENGVKFTI